MPNFRSTFRPFRLLYWAGILRLIVRKSFALPILVKTPIHAWLALGLSALVGVGVLGRPGVIPFTEQLGFLVGSVLVVDYLAGDAKPAAILVVASILIVVFMATWAMRLGRIGVRFWVGSPKRLPSLALLNGTQSSANQAIPLYSSVGFDDHKTSLNVRVSLGAFCWQVFVAMLFPSHAHKMRRIAAWPVAAGVMNLFSRLNIPNDQKVCSFVRGCQLSVQPELSVSIFGHPSSPVPAAGHVIDLHVFSQPDVGVFRWSSCFGHKSIPFRRFFGLPINFNHQKLDDADVHGGDLNIPVDVVGNDCFHATAFPFFRKLQDVFGELFFPCCLAFGHNQNPAVASDGKSANEARHPKQRLVDSIVTLFSRPLSGRAPFLPQFIPTST